MEKLGEFFSALQVLPVDHLNALIALAGLALAGFAIYVVHVSGKDRNK